MLIKLLIVRFLNGLKRFILKSPAKTQFLFTILGKISLDKISLNKFMDELGGR